MDDDEKLETEQPKVAIDADKLHVLSEKDAVELFDRELGTGTAWASQLMQYRTTSDFQKDWKIEVGNWLHRASQLGFLGDVLRNVVPQQAAAGQRTADDPVHRNVTQQLAQAMVTHYFVGTGWGFHAWEPQVPDLRASGIPADVDVQLCAPDGQVVDLQVKASGNLGVHDNDVNEHVRKGVQKATSQLPSPALRPAMVVVCAQRSWWLSADIDVLEEFIGSTSQYDKTVVLHEADRGEFATWPHISGIIVLDYRRSLESFDYSCIVLQNPWALHPIDPAWFSHARVLTHSNGEYNWLRGYPMPSTFPSGTTDFAGTKDDAFRMFYGAH